MATMDLMLAIECPTHKGEEHILQLFFLNIRHGDAIWNWGEVVIIVSLSWTATPG